MTQTGQGRAVLTEDDAEEARQVIRGCSNGEIKERQRCTSAKELLYLYATQQRYQLTPQTPAEYERALRQRNPRRLNHAQELEQLTPEALAERQARMTGDYPGKAV